MMLISYKKQDQKKTQRSWSHPPTHIVLQADAQEIVQFLIDKYLVSFFKMNNPFCFDYFFVQPVKYLYVIQK